MLMNGSGSVSLVVKNVAETFKRGIARIPHWEYHIRFAVFGFRLE